MSVMRAVVLIIVAGVLAALIGGFSYFQFVVKPEMIKGFITGAEQPPVTVSALPAQAETWSARLPAIGTLTPVKGADISPESGGVVQEIFFESGQDIKAGAPVITINDDVEQAELKSAQAELRGVQLAMERKKALSERGNASKAAYDDALAARDTALANIARVKAVIEKKKIPAPFDGKLGIRQVNIGQYVSPGTKLVTLQQLDPIYADFYLPEQYLGLVHTGLEIESTVDAFAGQSFKGVIESINPSINPDTRNVQVRAILQNPEFKLLPGMFANIQVSSGVDRTVVTVPRTAITYSLYGDSLYVVEKGEGDVSTAKRRVVKVGESQGDRVSILDGIKEGDTVIVNGQIKLYDGAKVVVDNSKPMESPTDRPKQ